MGFHFTAPGSVPESEARFAATLDGAQLLAKPLSLDLLRDLGPLEFVITGACAVDPNTGVRFGKGHGFFDTEWAILSELGLVNATTPVSSVCTTARWSTRDLVLRARHRGRWILTPTRTIEVAAPHPNPSGISWELVGPMPGSTRSSRCASCGAKAAADSDETAPDQLRAVAPVETRPSTGEYPIPRASSVRRSGPSLVGCGASDSRFHWDFGSFIADFEGSEALQRAVALFHAWATPSLSSSLPTTAQRPCDGPPSPTARRTHDHLRYPSRIPPAGPRAVPADEIEYAATLDGMDRYGHQLDLKALRTWATSGCL